MQLDPPPGTSVPVDMILWPAPAGISTHPVMILSYAIITAVVLYPVARLILNSAHNPRLPDDRYTPVIHCARNQAEITAETPEQIPYETVRALAASCPTGQLERMRRCLTHAETTARATAVASGGGDSGAARRARELRYRLELIDRAQHLRHRSA